MSVINFVVENHVEIIEAILAIVGAAAAIAAVTPSPKDDKVVSKVLGIVKKVADVVGMNVANAKNKD